MITLPPRHANDSERVHLSLVLLTGVLPMIAKNRMLVNDNGVTVVQAKEPNKRNPSKKSPSKRTSRKLSAKLPSWFKPAVTTSLGIGIPALSLALSHTSGKLAC